MFTTLKSVATPKLIFGFKRVLPFKIAPRKCSLFTHFQPHYAFGFFKKSLNREAAITQKIKATRTSEQLLKIIKERGQFMNMVNLTAILDRMEEEQMINTGQIIDFVINRLKIEEHVFRNIGKENVRALCNIVCYLGNIKNKQLNYIFQEISFRRVLSICNSIEKTMLVNGLIKLDLFSNFFSLQPQNGDKTFFDGNLLSVLDINQILSIWFALYNSQTPDRKSYLQVLQIYLSRDKLLSKKEIDLKAYAYALICYTQICKDAKEVKAGQLQEIIKNHMPIRSSKSSFLRAHQLSLLFQSIRQMENIKLQDSSRSFNLHLTDQFKKMINQSVRNICKRKNTTLRNISNVYKGMAEFVKLQPNTVRDIADSINSILLQEIKFRKKNEDNETEYKIDSLSLCTLSWKINELQLEYGCIDQETVKSIMLKIERYILEFIPCHFLEKISVNQLLMLYSGFYSYSKKHELDLNPQFEELSTNLIMKPELSFNIKELTLIYTYFKKIKFANPRLCNFLKNKMVRLSESTLKPNKVAESAIQKICLMDLGDKCKNCFKATE